MRRRPVSVIELAGYRRRASELLTPEQQEAVIDLIAYEPVRGDLIPRTGGLRKIRIGRDSSGKRGGARVVCTRKNEKGDLNAKEKREFTTLVMELVRQWKKKRRD